MKFWIAACPGKVYMDCGGSQGVVNVFLLKLVQDCTERCISLSSSTLFLFIYIFGLFRYGLWIFVCSLFSDNKEFDDWFLFICPELSSCDLLYIKGEMSVFGNYGYLIYIVLELVYFFEIAIFGSLRNFI